jgi:hypothetical protein
MDPSQNQACLRQVVRCYSLDHKVRIELCRFAPDPSGQGFFGAATSHPVIVNVSTNDVTIHSIPL